MSQMPEHVDESAGGPVCRHCGGRVDAEGFSVGGLVESVDSGEFESVGGILKEAEERESEEDAGHTEQQDDTERKRALAFADALARRYYKRGD